MAKAALCVGINEYVNDPDAALRGCVNDVQQMKGVLEDFLGFADSEIVELTDRAATGMRSEDGARRGRGALKLQGPRAADPRFTSPAAA